MAFEAVDPGSNPGSGTTQIFMNKPRADWYIIQTQNLPKPKPCPTCGLEIGFNVFLRDYACYSCGYREYIPAESNWITRVESKACEPAKKELGTSKSSEPVKTEVSTTQDTSAFFAKLHKICGKE